jgi:hypothetical protein
LKVLVFNELDINHYCDEAAKTTRAIS